MFNCKYIYIYSKYILVLPEDGGEGHPTSILDQLNYCSQEAAHVQASSVKLPTRPTSQVF